TYLSLFNYPVDAVVVNRILPGIVSRSVDEAVLTEPSSDPYLRHLQEIQVRYLAEIGRDFYPLPILRSQWFDKEMIGLQRLEALAGSLFGETDPGQVLFVGQAQEILEDGEDYVLQLPLPHVELNKVKMTKRGDELFISIGNFKRELLLPNVLAQRSAGNAIFNNGMLQVRFPPNPVGASA
ncbi:MAG: ArsA family ATPase, partial [Caldilineaceae bacterium]|nr:ArsA family ATPase [Caldilineaceae bacterium]